MSPAPTKGPISQRELAKMLITLVDAAMAGNSTAHKDAARSKIRALLSDPEVNWRSSYVLWNLGAKRCRWLASIGFWARTKWTWGWKGPKNEVVDGDE